MIISYVKLDHKFNYRVPRLTADICKTKRVRVLEIILKINRKICVTQKNVIEEKLLEIKRSIRRGIYLFQIHTGVFFQ